MAQIGNNVFLIHFWTTLKRDTPHHMKINIKIIYLGKKISIRPKKMTEPLAVEVDVKSEVMFFKSIFGPL